MGSKLVPCKSCEKEVSPKAKICPHCGAKLKMGFFKKLLIGLGALFILGIFLSAGQPTTQDKLTSIKEATPEKASPTGELAQLFELGSNHTDIQRDNAINSLKGKVVQWKLPVYEVKKPTEQYYKVQTSLKSGQIVGTSVYLHPQSDAERQKIEALKTGEWITVKGTVDGSLMRHIVIKPAILIN